MITGLALELLRRHVGHRPRDRARLCGGGQRVGTQDRIRAGFFLAQLGQAEVEHLDPAIGVEHDVGRFDVLVDDPSFMGGAEGVRERHGHFEQRLEVHPAFGDQLRQGLAFHELHGEKKRTLIFFDGMDRNDTGVVQRCHRARLAFETPSAIGGASRLRREDLQRDATVQLGIQGYVHLAHAALPRERNDLVMVQCFPDQESVLP